MKFFISVFSFVLTTLCYSQSIVTKTLVGEKGITENVKEATSFIVIKKYPSSFEKLEYKPFAPLQRFSTYTDSTLSILQGNYGEYNDKGALLTIGYYISNKKQGDWRYYNDSGKMILIKRYNNDSLIKTPLPDTVKKSNKNKIKRDEKVAFFKDGESGWRKYLLENLNIDLASKSKNGGLVKAVFKIGKDGHCIDVYLQKSVEFILDEELKRVIQKSTNWQPASRDGNYVGELRLQSITFIKP